MEHLTQAWKTIYGGWNILNLQKFMHLKFSSFHTPPCPSKKTCLNRVILSLQSGSSVSTTTLQLLLSDVTPRRTMELQMKTIKQTMKLYISYVYRLYYIYILYIYIYIYISYTIYNIYRHIIQFDSPNPIPELKPEVQVCGIHKSCYMCLVLMSDTISTFTPSCSHVVWMYSFSIWTRQSGFRRLVGKNSRWLLKKPNKHFRLIRW